MTAKMISGDNLSFINNPILSKIIDQIRDVAKAGKIQRVTASLLYLSYNAGTMTRTSRVCIVYRSSLSSEFVVTHSTESPNHWCLYPS